MPVSLNWRGDGFGIVEAVKKSVYDKSKSPVYNFLILKNKIQTQSLFGII